MTNQRDTYPQGPVEENGFEDALVVVGTNREAVMQNEANLIASCASTNVHSRPKENARMWTHVKLCRKAKGGIIKSELANNISHGWQNVTFFDFDLINL